MPVEFLTEDEAAAYGRYAGSPSQADLERVFFLDDEDMALVDQRRGDHMKVGFALQLVTVRWLGTFLNDPLDVPGAVLEFVAGQLGVADPLVVNKYGERVKTLSDHQLEIRRAERLRDFTEAQDELAGWVAARSWTSGNGRGGLHCRLRRPVPAGRPAHLGRRVPGRPLHHALARKICHGKKASIASSVTAAPPIDAASSMPRPSRLCSCTTIVTAAPDARISRARATALSSSGRVTARVEIFSAKARKDQSRS